MSELKIRSLDELSDFEKLALVNMSYSRINTYDMCPKKYYFDYIQKEPRIFGPAAALGTVVHAVLEDHVGEDLDTGTLIESMHRHREQEDPDHEIDAGLMATGEEILTQFVEIHGDEEFEIVGKELAFQIVIGSAYIRGFIDLVVRNAAGVISIIDYKTGRHEITFKDAPMNLQIGIYVLALAHLFPEEDEFYGELYYLRSLRRKGHLFHRSDLPEVYDRVLESVNTIINDQNYTATEDNTYVCRFCDHRKSGACKVGIRRFGRY